MNNKLVSDALVLMDRLEKTQQMVITLKVSMKIRNLLKDTDLTTTIVKNILKESCFSGESGPLPLLVIKLKRETPIIFVHSIGDIVTVIRQFVEDRMSRHIVSKVLDKSVEDMKSLIISESILDINKIR